MSDFPEVKDHLVANPDKYTMTTNPDGTVTLRPTWVDNPAEVLQEGTPVNAAFLAKIPEAIDAIDTKVTSQLADKVSQAEALTLLGGISEGTPLFAPDTLSMTDTTRNYVNTTDGLLYTHNGTAWVSTGVPYQATGIADKAVTVNKTDFVTPAKNLLNPANSETGRLLSNYGTTTSNAIYSTSEYIPVDGNTTYAISNVRITAQYDADKIGVSETFANTGSNTGTAIITTDVSTRFIQISYQTGLLTQVEKGAVATAYEEYGYQIGKLSFTDAQYQAINEKVKDTVFEASGKAVSVIKSGEMFKLVSAFDATDNIEIETARNGSSNGSFNILKTTVGTVELVRNTDDITPIRTFTTVGGNHGYTTIVRITMSGHGKTNVDLGSRWSDGVTTYTLLQVIGNDLVFGCPYTVTDSVVTATKVNPVATLTHVSGATNTGDVSITTLVASPQLYPTINNISVKYVLDGKEITEDGTYYGDVLEVQEQYNIMDYKAIIDFAQANVGVSYANDSVEGVVQLTNTFIFRKGLKCTTAHGIKALKKVTLANCGFLQAAALEAAGYTRKRFLPGVLPKSGFDFEAGVDLDAYATSLLFVETDNKVPGVAPSHYTDWLYLAGVRKYGFSMGYIVDKTNSKHADRIALGGTLWDMRSTKKSYPVALKGTLQAGDYRSFMGFRNYLSPEEVGSATTLNVVEDAKDTYLYAHLNTPVTNISKKVDGRIGDNIAAIQNDGVTLKNDVVDASGVVLSSAGAVSNAIIKLT